MKKIALTLTALAAFTGSASAADLAARPYAKAAPMPVAVASWTGCYVGGGGGYGLWNQENTLYTDPAVGARAQLTQTTTSGGRGYFGTVQGGCDYQFGLGTWNLVVGAFGDYDFADIHGQHGMLADGVAREKLTDQWSVGGRIGALITPQLLTYFSAGYTEAKFDRQNYTTFGAPFALTGSYTPGRTYTGYFIGAGDEYALSFLPGLFWKTEYRFSSLDTQNNPLYVTATGARAFTFSEDSTKYVHTVRSELVYRFNWGGPVVAKY